MPSALHHNLQVSTSRRDRFKISCWPQSRSLGVLPEACLRPLSVSCSDPDQAESDGTVAFADGQEPCRDQAMAAGNWRHQRSRRFGFNRRHQGHYGL